MPDTEHFNRGRNQGNVVNMNTIQGMDLSPRWTYGVLKQGQSDNEHELTAFYLTICNTHKEITWRKTEIGRRTMYTSGDQG